MLLRVLLAPAGAAAAHADSSRNLRRCSAALGSAHDRPTALPRSSRGCASAVSTCPPASSADARARSRVRTVVVPELPRDALTFVYDYPASQAALARVKPANPPVAARFEVFAGGIELANGFHELTDRRASSGSRFESELGRADVGAPGAAARRGAARRAR